MSRWPIEADGVVQISPTLPPLMDASEVGTLLRRWFAGERLEVREQQDSRADVHLAVKYPPGPRGHTFTVVVPKGRDLVAISSVTRVDAGQQDEMSTLMQEEEEDWKAWVHEMRMHLITSGVDWNLSMGHDGKARPGPLQAFNVSLPVWFDGLTKNEIMQSLRTLWMSKLGLIHEIKYGAQLSSPKRFRSLMAVQQLINKPPSVPTAKETYTSCGLETTSTSTIL